MFSNSWTKAPSNLEIKKKEVHLWKAFISENEFYVNHLKKNLSKEELNRAEKFYQVKAKICYILGRGILKKILSIYLNEPIQNICFDYNIFGKPYIRNQTNSLPIQFNISHSNDIIIFAFTLDQQVGVDIEYNKSIITLDSIAKTVFSEIEYNKWQESPQENKIHLFYQLWTYKEAIIKALGSGFSYNTKNFTVQEINQQAKVIFCDKDIHSLWTIKSIMIEKNYHAAFATPQINIKINGFEWI